ncbi:EUKARYOTIC TRANSLATION INITIATION FACTOR 3 SUBUNIT J [Salix viminalis]|uniref:Eukaryotic translation initiation factor 3 subunit J n=2 Tax=Salix TaxID=40685 RepID=A0A9Q1AD70_SALPP|nr:EUKARYOTIC TRANSLATION INITIATION FACTOR 3 SUBUNIT J [Salix viminalis]KAJ6707354.1 EUKARYOTIC TRANSLATION INITIATION FACTOR 3 SUBUNIT J [Salix viminalis]KAJ6766705.1 EUKARYOTIC TRANSLATION INITIATION FACTOR 3 SUBUNIT J [Salix purpurea]KAJ6766706.1 EUKARYOTIC TRANSLATION INITIATION FACTOR 3 SUBUNIT J [Salix purpurea]
MEDWEEEQIPSIAAKDKPISKWDDEDVDEDDVKESWEDDDEPDPAPVVEPPPEKAPKKPVTKPTEKKGKTAEVVKEQPLDPLAEKLHQQRLVEEADFRSTTELFAKKDDEKSLDIFIPKSESDFLEYAELISHKLRPFEKSYHYINLLKTVMRLSMTSMKAADAKEVSTSVSAIANEKIKAEKEATGKKKTAVKKKNLIVDKPSDDLAGNAYEALDDFDFM